MTKIADIIILGGGPAGCTAALYAARAALDTLMIEKLAPGGQVATTEHVDNYPGFPDGIDGYSLGERMEKQAARFGSISLRGEVVRVSLDGPVKEAELADGTVHRARAIILAPGASPRELGLAGERELRGRGVSYCATCDGAFYRGRDVLIVGGGDTAAMDALFLARICRKVTLIHRRDTLRAARVYQEQLRAQDNVTFLWDSAVEEILSGETSRVSGVRVRQLKTGESREIAGDGLFIAVGNVPNTSLFRGLLELDEAGYLTAGEDTLTALPGVFAAGDARKKPLRQVLTAAADGAVAAAMAEEYLARPYPGLPRR
ncbi:MAG: thioredoxin-disulfide reductase [Clostridiales bacterium]|nr:thioredoxin-disulfide reductase [Clostridiales bacterium]